MLPLSGTNVSHNSETLNVKARAACGSKHVYKPLGYGTAQEVG